jgi:nitrate/TMAO reductase-like tetraheme cytochrome c subunit
MKRTLLIIIVLLAATGFAAAQNFSPSTDVLGAHLNYGRGCTACHAPHSGAYGNGNAKTADPTSGNVALWGEDVGSLYGKTITTGGSGRGNYAETLPAAMSTSSEAFGLLTCLSCHDGNYATGAMMKNAVYEPLPSTYGGWNTIPTLLGNDGTTTGNYLNDHPVGAAATFGCNAPAAGQTYGESGYNWDCAISGTTITAGPNMARFINNYGFFVALGTSTSTTSPIVVCTTCHNQHLMNVVSVAKSANVAAGSSVTSGLSGQTAGTYQTMFFLRGPYNPWNTASNSSAQFCRQCHGGESNEMNNGTAVTTF